ncbi:hypothetical protein [Emticicia sp. 17c]|uniref:hypothetical protein n=1 Tax=Emticicia sp. 17c TaxID=3127704 RepID=UPI00301BA164
MTLTIENNPAKESPLTGNLIFYQHMLPPLTSSATGAAESAAVGGTYKLTVEETISSKDGKIEETTYQNINVFGVRSPRFSLPGLISSVYPPESAQGEYANVLAHVCLNRGTLPWERNAVSGASGFDAEADKAPWLGTLLFYETDPAVAIKQVTLLELTNVNKSGTLPAGTFFPPFELEDGEQYTDSCMVIDIPVALFNQVAPTLADLPWLAHVREIQPTNKQSAKYLDKLKTLSSETDSPKLSTVITNRLPITGAQNVACLVSFENYAKYLPGNDGSQSADIPAGTETVRMILLKQWQFFATKQDQTFSGYLLNLNKKDGQPTGTMLQLNPDNGTSEADKAINNAFNMGYVPLNHHTRQGDNTVSWYKGPFLPFVSAGTIDIPVNGPDTCTAYNPDTGMFDVSFAAAWQLGRLLALQNGNFATALYNWKRANTQEAISAFEEEMIKKTLKEIVDEEAEQTQTDEARIIGRDAAQLELAQLMAHSLNKILSQFINNKDGENTIEIR